MWVKICGLTNPDDAVCALDAGADALGFIFVRQSPRYLPAHDPDWQAWLPALQGATRVLVVSDPAELPDGWERCFEVVQWVVREPIPSMPTLQSLLRISFVEPPPSGSPYTQGEPNHGSPREAGGTLRRGGEHSNLTLWLAMRFPPECTADAILQTLDAWQPYAERFVLDTYHPTLLGGTGLTQDWARLREVCARAPRPILLAGGLTPENVADAIRTARPAGVDVSSGVEAAPGRKDPAKVRAFIRNAKTALEGEGG
ncbi:MAG: phosphoribosylanthranilate isomerase [Armatimonadota bacterium]|nr:phosphoribosylanthranilate isomerase [Armatimonadota bacterium]